MITRTMLVLRMKLLVMMMTMLRALIWSQWSGVVGAFVEDAFDDMANASSSRYQLFIIPLMLPGIL